MRLISKYGWIRTLHVATLRAKAFMRAPWAGGVVLLACVVAAMLLADLPEEGFPPQGSPDLG